jgi:predicted deacylase
MSLEAFREIRPELGELGHGWVEVPGVDPPWQLPVAVVRGSSVGPTLAVTAGVHACEYAPMEALRRFVQSIDRTQLKGVVVAVLLVNTPGFPTRTVFVNPRDGKNINRQFPGSKTGSPAERVTDFLMRELIAKSDAYIDCHCGDMVEAMTPFAAWTRTGDAKVDATSQAMATAYTDSLVFVSSLEQNRGMSFGEAAALGIPSLIGEAGQQGVCDDTSVHIHFGGLQNALKVLGMVEGLPTKTTPRVMAEIQASLTTASGFFHPTVAVGDTVTSGQKVGEVTDVFGSVLEEAFAPSSGLVMCLTTGLAINAGECMLEIGVSA